MSGITKGSLDVNLEYESLSANDALAKFLARIMASHEKMVSLVIGTNEQLVAELDSRRKSEVETEQRRLQLMIELEESISQRKQREREERDAEEVAKVKRELIDEFKTLLPGIVNGIAGRQLMAPKENQALTTFLANLSEAEQVSFQTFYDSLAPGKKAALDMLLEQLDKGSSNGT